jgi:hypothetical protein
VDAKNFFILALPRSRTAWLANLFTTGEVFCFHDASRMVQYDLPSVLRHSPETATYVGDSDNGLALFPHALKDFPNAPIVVVERDAAEVRASLGKLASHQRLPREYLDQMTELTWDRLQSVRTLPQCKMVVAYEDLDDVDVLEEMWNALVPQAAPFDRARAEHLMDFHVELHPTRYVQKISSEARRFFSNALVGR